VKGSNPFTHPKAPKRLSQDRFTARSALRIEAFGSVAVQLHGLMSDKRGFKFRHGRLRLCCGPKLIGRAMKVLGKLGNVPNVEKNSCRSVVSPLAFFQHALSKIGHKHLLALSPATQLGSGGVLPRQRLRSTTR